MAEELKPCPFCGGDAMLITPPFSRPYVACLDNFCSGPKETPDKAVAAWNRRAGDPK
jgi:Lar family restriction alleviation protein